MRAPHDIHRHRVNEIDYGFTNHPMAHLDTESAYRYASGIRSAAKSLHGLWIGSIEPMAWLS